MQILYMGICLSVLFNVNSVRTLRLEGKCLGSGSYYGDGRMIGELSTSEDFTSEISDTVQIIGVKCCDARPSSIRESLQKATRVNGSHSTNANWKCLHLFEGVQEPEDWTQASFNDRSWPRAKEIPKDTLADHSYVTLGDNKWIWLSDPTLRCPAPSSCLPTCSLCRLDVAQEFCSSLVKGVIRYPGSDSPLEDSVYLASEDFIVDVMGCESATLTLKLCNGNSGNLVEVFFSAKNNISSKIELCQNFPNNSTKCSTVAASLNATISCFYYQSFYVAFPPDGSLSVSRSVRSEEPLMSFSGWQTDRCHHVTSVVMSQRHTLAKFSFYRNSVENRCLVTKDEVAQLEQCGDDHIDQQFCLSCGCCWQPFATNFSKEETPYDFRCFHSFANSTRPSDECRHRSLKEIIGDIVFSVNGTTVFSEDPVAFVVGVKNAFDGIKISVQFGDGSSLDSLTLNRMETSPVWAGNATDDCHKATFIHRYDVFGEITALLKITDSRNNNTEVVMASVNFTVEFPDLIILSSKTKVDLYEEEVFVLLTRNFGKKTTADVILGDNETRYNLNFDSKLAFPSWVDAMYMWFQSIIILPHFYSSAGEKEVIAKKVIHDNSAATTSDRLSARILVTVRSLNETFARALFLTLSEEPVAENEPVEYMFSLPRIINNTEIHVDFGDGTFTVGFAMDNLSNVPNGIRLVQNDSQYMLLFEHAYQAPGAKQPVVRISLKDQPDEAFERSTITKVMQSVSNVSLLADINTTDLYEDVTFVLSANNVYKLTRVLIDFGDGEKDHNVSLRRDIPLPVWFQKMQLQIEHWAVFTHAFSSPGLHVVTANLTNNLEHDSDAVTATVNIRIRSLDDTLQQLLESLTVQMGQTSNSEAPILVRMKIPKLPKDTVISINYGDNSETVDFNLTTATHIPDELNFSHKYNLSKMDQDEFNMTSKDQSHIVQVYNHSKKFQIKFSITSKDQNRTVQVNVTKNITWDVEDECKPEESIRLLGDVVIITQNDYPIVEGDTVSFLVLTKHFLNNFHLMLSDGTAAVNVNLKLDTKFKLPPSAKKFSSYFQAAVRHTFCDHGSFWLRFTLFSCRNASLENITKYLYTKIFSFKEFIGNPIIFPVKPSRTVAHENVTFLIVLENVNNAAFVKLDFGDQHLLNVSLSARQIRLHRLMAERKLSGHFKTAVNHSYASERSYEVTVQVNSKSSECVIEGVESKGLVHIVPLSADTIDVSVESQSYQSLPVNEMIAFDIYTRKELSDYEAHLDFGSGSNASFVAYVAPEISQGHSYRKQSYPHRFLHPGLYTVAVNVAGKQQDRSETAQAKRSRCVNVIAFEEAVGKVKIFAIDEGNRKFLVGEAVQFVVLVKNSMHGMLVSVSYGDRSSQKDTITFQEWELSLPSWLLLYQKEQYHYGIANHIFTNAGAYRVTVNITKNDLDFNVSSAVVESLWITIHPKTILSIIVAGGGADISSAVKYTRQEQIQLSASILGYNDGDLNISWSTNRLKSMATRTQDTEVIFIPPDVDTAKTSLSIPPFSLNFGTYIFQIQLSQKVNRGLLKVIASNYTWITITVLPIQAVVSMKKQYNDFVSWIELDGSGSNDPNEARNDHLIYEWHCTQGGNNHLLQSESLCNGTSRCARSCTNLPAGNHQSCLGCNFYATCYDDTFYDSRPCPAKSFWDDKKKRCSTNSATCICKESVTGCFREMRLHLTGPVIKFTAHAFKFSRSQVDYFFDLVVVNRLGVLGKSDGVKVSIIAQHFLHDSLPPPPQLSIICKSNCNPQLQQQYPLILSFRCLYCRLSEDDTLSPSWKVTGNSTMTNAELNWKREVIYHQDSVIIKPAALSKITPGNEYMVTLKVTGSGRSISATYKFSVSQTATAEYQKVDTEGH